MDTVILLLEDTGPSLAGALVMGAALVEEGVLDAALAPRSAGVEVTAGVDIPLAGEAGMDPLTGPHTPALTP